MIGTRLGPYDLLAEIGRGGMATVYRAYQASVERPVAVKVIHKAIASDEAALERFRREARLIARLEHPHILPLYDFDGAHDPPYIVMRYVDSGTLKDALTTRPLPHDDIGFLLRQIASALDYAHEQGIVHRDIKPANIMLDRKGNVLVSDFGIARMLDSATRTQSGTTAGTPGYMAPEQVLGADDLDGRADTYALAVLTFELLTGQLPFDADSAIAVMMKHVQQTPPPPSRFNPALPAAVDAVLARGLAKAPAARYASAGAFAAALSAALGASTTATPAAVTAVVQATLVARHGAPPSTDEHTIPAEAHKTVTALYANAAEYSTLIEEQVGAEAARRALRVLWERVTQAVHARAGDVVAQAENHLLAVWGARATHEDDAERAVHAALDVQATMRELSAGQFSESDDEPLPVSIGVHTGLALIASGATQTAFTATGVTLTLAEKLAEHAEGIVLISHDTFREVQGVFDIFPATPLKVRGRKEALSTYRITVPKARAFRVRMHGVEGLEIPLAGHEAELKRLQSAYLNAYEERETQAVTVLGEVGLGKSRLLEEFSKWYDLRPERIRVFQGHATPAMTARPYALWRDVLSLRFEILDDDPLPVVRTKLEHGVAKLLAISMPADAELPEAEREIAHLMGYLAGFDLGDSPHIKGLLGDAKQLTTRARQLVGRFFTRLGALQSSVIELEDMHYADDASLDLFDELANTQSTLPLVLVYFARPGLLERRPAWGKGQASHLRLTLAPLDKRESRDLARALLQKLPDPPKALRDLLVERAEGNPLFMEELVKMLLDDRVLVKEVDAWRVEVSRLTTLRVPPSLIGVLQARLDTLLHPEKLTLQRAAVFGRVFADSLLAALDAADDTHLADLPARLHTLEQRGFITRLDNASFAGSTDYTFTQGLLRDLIYSTLLERQRHTYHAACARWLTHTERAEEYWPLIGEHHEKAGETEAAAQALEQAGDRATQVSAFGDAVRFYQRALQTVENAGPATEDSEHAARRFTKLAEAYFRLADFSAVRTALDNALRRTTAPATRAIAVMLLGRMTGPIEGDHISAYTLFVEALSLARASADPNVLARALLAWAGAHMRLGYQVDLARTYLEESLLLARSQDNTIYMCSALNGLGSSYMQFDLTQAECFFKEAHTLALARNNRESAMVALNNQGVVADMRSDWTTAKALYQQGLILARELGMRRDTALGIINLASANIQLHDHLAARAELREGLVLASELGTLPLIVLVVTYFANLLAAEGATVRALALLGLARNHPATTNDLRREIDIILTRWNLDPATVAAGLAAGAALDFDATVAEILRELAQDA